MESLGSAAMISRMWTRGAAEFVSAEGRSSLPTAASGLRVAMTGAGEAPSVARGGLTCGRLKPDNNHSVSARRRNEDLA